MEYVDNFKELEVYKLSKKLSKEIYEITKDLLERYVIVGKMLNSMMEKSNKFCKPAKN